MKKTEFCGNISKKEKIISCRTDKKGDDNYMAENSISMTNQAYQQVKNAIQNCLYMPGDSLSEKELCEKLKCGRTPVREALLKLRDEGLIEIFPRKGIQVATFHHQQISEIYQIRKLIEPTACEKYYLSLDKAKLLAFDTAFKEVDRNDNHAYYALDIEFHSFLVAAANNQRLSDFFDGLMEIQYRFGIYSSKIGTAVKHDYYTEHHEIIEALLAEEKENICKTIIAHINYSEVIALKTLECMEP